MSDVDVELLRRLIKNFGDSMYEYATRQDKSANLQAQIVTDFRLARRRLDNYLNAIQPTSSIKNL